MEKIDPSLEEFLINTRRDLHKHPELGWCEFRTTSIVAEHLQGLGYQIYFINDLIDPKSVIGRSIDLSKEKARVLQAGANAKIINDLEYTGLIATLNFAQAGANIGFRFDLDAVAVQESHDPDHLPYTLGFHSLYQGINHACGHDGHVALGLSLATYIATHKDQFKGSVTLIFQPAEEGCRGAYSLKDLTLIKQIDLFYAFHLGICAKSYELVLNPDHFLVSSKFKIEIFGKSVHAGINPKLGINALHCAVCVADQIFRLAEIRSSARTNLGNFISNNAQNVISDYVSFNAECRDLTEKLNYELVTKIKDILSSTCEKFKASYKLTLIGCATDFKNSESQAQMVKRVALSLGHKVLETGAFNACEDCSLIIKSIQEANHQASYYVLGNSIKAPHHSEKFDLDESSLKANLSFLINLAHELLKV